jgi:hypothetical protein
MKRFIVKSFKKRKRKMSPLSCYANIVIRTTTTIHIKLLATTMCAVAVVETVGVSVTCGVAPVVLVSVACCVVVELVPVGCCVVVVLPTTGGSNAASI